MGTPTTQNDTSVSLKSEEIEKEDIRRMYYDEGSTQEEIGNYYNRSKSYVSKRMKRYGLEARSTSDAARQYSYNQDFFETWTPESVWMYGWFFGDGWVNRNRVLGIGLSPIDKEVLYKFKNILNAENPILDYDHYDKRYSKTYKTSTICFYSPKMVQDFQNINVYNIPKEFTRDFIRGFFEAEGSILIHQNYILTSFVQKDKEILKHILYMLRNIFAIVKGGSLTEYDGYWRLHFSEHDSVSLYHFLYDNCNNLFLERKKNKFEESLLIKGYA